jgi:hypothetical protein
MISLFRSHFLSCARTRFAESAKLGQTIKENLRGLGYGS